jgi:HEAT repeats
MDVFQTKPPGPDVPGPDTRAEDVSVTHWHGSSQLPDARLQPTPDYGTLGPNSDVAQFHAAYRSAPSADDVSNRGQRAPGNLRAFHLLAIVGGVVGALVASTSGTPFHSWEKIAARFARHGNSPVASAKLSERDLDRQQPERQAEILLTRAVSRSDGATDQIQSHIEGWRGKLKWNPQLSQLTTVALNSADENVRASAIEVQLAAYGLKKSDSTVEAQVRQADSSTHAQKIWALWTLGLLGNRGIETDRVVQVLSAHLLGAGRDSDADTRGWAVEGLALVGTTSTIAPLLKALHDDPSALVRERAACSLAESGMLTREQRLTAVPQLIHYSDDPALDAQTHAWAFQALADITQQRLPNDPAAWRVWYQNAVAVGQ